MEVRSVEAIAGALNGADIRYIVVGGLAVNAHGYERFTHDIDLVIGLEPENIRRALYALMEVGYRPTIPVTPEDFANADNRATWQKEKSMLVLKLWSDEHRRTPVDVFIREPFDFDEEWNRALMFQMNETLNVPVLCYPSLVRMKLDAGRDKDLLDVKELKKLDPYRA